MFNCGKYHIICLGCQMNKSDAERVSAVFEQLNCSVADNVENADYVVIIACSVRQTAVDRIWGFAKQFEELKFNKNKSLKTILTGCLLPADQRQFKRRFNLVVDIKDLAQLRLFINKQSTDDIGEYFSVQPKYSNAVRAYVPIMTGCDNYCSYCVVPYVRGREMSRTVREILIELKCLADKGYKEIQLLGQNVNSFNPMDKESFSTNNPFTDNFAKLLWEINQIDNIQRIHFTSSHPKDVSSDLIKALTLPKQVNYIHFALQSGDDEVLERMNRKYSVEDYYKIIQQIRKIKPSISIGTDIIVGFPGETEKQFENTLAFYKKVEFDIAYTAMYSPRKGTAAAKFIDDVARVEKKRRWRALQDLMEEISLNKNKQFIGKEVSVLIDAKKEDCCEGNSLEMKRVRIMNSDYNIGDVAQVIIKQVKEWILIA